MLRRFFTFPARNLVLVIPALIVAGLVCIITSVLFLWFV